MRNRDSQYPISDRSNYDVNSGDDQEHNTERKSRIETKLTLFVSFCYGWEQITLQNRDTCKLENLVCDTGARVT